MDYSFFDLLVVEQRSNCLSQVELRLLYVIHRRSLVTLTAYSYNTSPVDDLAIVLGKSNVRKGAKACKQVRARESYPLGQLTFCMGYIRSKRCGSFVPP